VIKNSRYICQQCGYESVGWLGKCPNCGSWNSLVETIVETGKGQEGITRSAVKGKSKESTRPVNLSSISSRKTARISTKISELDRVLGGGLVPGQVVLVAGEPGIGKSTLLLQLADKLGDTLYICGEESVNQIALRGKRLGIKSKTIHLLAETDVDSVIETVNQLTSKSVNQLSTIVVDSIQTVTTDDLTGLAGSVGQVRECAARLLRVAKSKNIPLFLVGHVTKEGTVAGPAVLAHIVDTVLWFEGEKSLSLRLLRAIKNRFGATDEVGIFEMADRGLIPQIDAEKIFLTQKGKGGIPGSVVSSVLNGTRPMLVEIQSLVVPTKMAFSKRSSQGIDLRRLEMLLAVLIRRCGLPLYDWDVFVNVAGGLTVREPACDLAICLSIASAYFEKALPTKTIALGEVGLLGEIREVVAQEKRIKEARRLGFSLPLTSSQTRYVSEAIKRLVK
jgi:DNA repair protein RadA/Sms